MDRALTAAIKLLIIQLNFRYTIILDDSDAQHKQLSGVFSSFPLCFLFAEFSSSSDSVYCKVNQYPLAAQTTSGCL